MEPTEIEEFTKEMKEGGEAGMKTVSLMISILAVLVAMVTVLGHRTHTKAILSQTRAADQWNEYQAKKIRLSQVSGNADLLALQPNASDAAAQKKLGEYKQHMQKWNDELAEEQKEALKLEQEVKLSETRADRYDLGEALLQIAVVLSSITLLTRQRAYFVMGLLLGIAGLLLSASALLVR
jgi:hypothetical protein